MGLHIARVPVVHDHERDVAVVVVAAVVDSGLAQWLVLLDVGEFALLHLLQKQAVVAEDAHEVVDEGGGAGVRVELVDAAAELLEVALQLGVVHLVLGDDHVFADIGERGAAAGCVAPLNLEEAVDIVLRVGDVLDGLGGLPEFLVVAQGRLVVVDVDIANASGAADSVVVAEEGVAHLAPLLAQLCVGESGRHGIGRVGLAPERLPITVTAHIVHANALEVDWREILPETSGTTYVFGNPPFIGARMKSKEQKADLARVWGTTKGVNDMDYVTGWHAQARTLLAERRGEFAFVTTNSITQGQPVPALFGPLIREGWRIKFAHRTFQWDSEAPGKAAVHCVIVGFTRNRGVKQRLWDYSDVRGEAVEHKVEQGINAYLIDGPNVLVANRSTPLSPEITPARFGSMANDGGNLIVETSEYDEVVADPIAAKYLRPFKGSRELVRGLNRWCLWLADDFDAADVAKSSVLRERITAVRELRAASKRKATADLARTPHLFGEVRQPKTEYLCIPKVVSETRPYLTAERLTPDVIVSDLAFHAQDPDGLLLALVSSSMFIVWQKAVGGRLKSDLRFSNTLVWNTFPVPELDDKTRQRIIDAGEKVLWARELHPDRSLAEHYNPLAMDPILIKAHDELVREVDKAFGAPRKLTNERQRQELLFTNYATLTRLEQ